MPMSASSRSTATRAMATTASSLTRPLVPTTAAGTPPATADRASWHTKPPAKTAAASRNVADGVGQQSAGTRLHGGQGQGFTGQQAHHLLLGRNVVVAPDVWADDGNKAPLHRLDEATSRFRRLRPGL